MTRRVAVWLRVSTEEQRFDSQSDAIEHYVQARGWEVVKRFEEYGVSGAAQNRKVVDEILKGAKRKHFDSVVVFRGDRAFRTAGRGCLFIDELTACDCAFVSIDDGLDTGTNMGQVMAKIVSVLAEWERAGLRSRQQAGIAAARARGKHIGRPKRIVDVGLARELLSRGHTMKATAEKLAVAPATLRKALRSIQGEQQLPSVDGE